MSEISNFQKSAMSPGSPGIALRACSCGHHYLSGSFGCPHCGKDAEAADEIVASGPFAVTRSIRVAAPLAPWPPTPFVIAEIEITADLTGLAVIADAQDPILPGSRVAIGDVSHDYPLFNVVAENEA